MAMEYVTGLPALNLGDRPITSDDWHHSAMDWDHPYMLDTDYSPFGTWGINRIEVSKHGMMPAADHIRACLACPGISCHSPLFSVRQAADRYSAPRC